ncbi:hypothetical protein R6Q57_021408 [Mikania cordata]
MIVCTVIEPLVPLTFHESSTFVITVCLITGLELSCSMVISGTTFEVIGDPVLGEDICRGRGTRITYRRKKWTNFRVVKSWLVASGRAKWIRITNLTGFSRILLECRQSCARLPPGTFLTLCFSVRFESVIFRRPKEVAAKQNEMQQSTGVVEAIIVEVNNRDKIGGPFLKSNAICCTPELASDGSCKVGEVIIRQDPDNPDWPKRIQTPFGWKNEEAKMLLQTVEINRTGMYYLYFMFCDPQLNGTIITSGRTVWRNPDGYLPGKMAPLLPFYGFMSLAYLILGLLWFVRFVQHWKDIIQLHYHITIVIGLGMCEMALWYYDYANFNVTGSRPIGITLWAVTFSACKKTFSRLLLLVVSMGYGVVRPTLGCIILKVLLLGFIYFLASEALELFENVGNINEFSGKAGVFLVLPVALLDSCFILWIFSSLSKTLEKLQIRKSIGKLELYRKFTNALALSVLVSVAWIGYELYFNASDPLSELWVRAWIIQAFWDVLAYILLVVTCFLWSPSHNPTR